MVDFRRCLEIVVDRTPCIIFFVVEAVKVFADTKLMLLSKRK